MQVGSLVRLYSSDCTIHDSHLLAIVVEDNHSMCYCWVQLVRNGNRHKWNRKGMEVIC